METLEHSNSIVHSEQSHSEHQLNNSMQAGEFANEGPTTNLEGEALLHEIRRQIEIIFQKQKHLNDNNLATYVNSEGYIPLGAFLNVPEITALTSSIDHLCDSLRSSSIVTLDEPRKLIKSNLKVQRTTIIIRDIPSSTPVEDLKALFEQDGAPGRVTGIRPEIGDNWFVSFESEDIAIDTLTWLRSQLFDGNPIKARIKSENMVKSVYVYIPPAEISPTEPSTFGAGSYTGYQQQQQSLQENYRSPFPYWESGSKNGDNSNFPRNTNYDRGRPNFRNRRKGDYRKGPPSSPPPEDLPSAGGRGGPRNKTRGRPGKKPESFISNTKPFATGTAHVPSLASAHFPPLPSVKADPSASPSGYGPRKYKKYPKEEMIKLLSSFVDISIPVVLKPVECIAIDLEPNTVLENTGGERANISVEDTSVGPSDEHSHDNLHFIDHHPADISDEDLVEQQDDPAKKEEQRAKFSYADIARTAHQ